MTHTNNTHTMTITELRQKRKGIIEQMREARKKAIAAMKEGKSTDEYDAEFDRAEADERALSKQIEQEERLDKIERDEAAKFLDTADRREHVTSSKADDYRAAFKTWFVRGENALSPEERAVLNEIRGTSNQVVGTTTLGGYTVPTGFLPELIRAMKAYSGIAQVARMLDTESGNVLYIPTEDDTTTEANLITEASAITVQDITFGQKQLDAYKYSTQTKVSLELMQDSAFDLEAEVRNVFAPRFGRALNTSCTTGSGSSQPNGVVTAASLGKTAASATAITFAEIMDLLHAVDPAYRQSNTCGFMLHDSILAAIKKLQLGSGDATPLWLPSVREGEPDTILGKPYWINQGMDSALTTGKKVMLFGDFNYYVIRMVQNMLVVRLNERYADNGLVGFVGHMRWDGECLNTAAIKYLITA